MPLTLPTVVITCDSCHRAETHTVASVFALIRDLEEKGWTFGQVKQGGPQPCLCATCASRHPAIARSEATLVGGLPK